MKAVFPLLGVAGITALVAVLASSCGLLSPAQQAPAQPIVVPITNNGGSDGILAVLLTVAGIGAFLLLAAALILGGLWWHERRRRVNAETVVSQLTGRPIDQISLAVAPPISTERLEAQLPSLRQLTR